MTKQISVIINELPAFTSGQIWQRLATALGWKMAGAALKLCEMEDKEGAAKAAADEKLKADGTLGANVDDTPFDVARALQTAELVASDPYSTGQQRMTPQETLTAFEDVRGAAAIKALMAYRDAPVQFSAIVKRASTPQPVPASQLQAFLGLLNDPDLPEAVAQKLLDDYNAGQAARYVRHRSGIMMHLSTVNNIDADFDEALEEAHEEVRAFVITKTHDALSKRLALVDLSNAAAPEWVQRIPPLARLQEIKLLKGAIKDMDAVNAYYVRQTLKLAM